MHARLTTTTLRTVFAQLDTAGATVPKATATAQAKLTALAAKVEALRPTPDLPGAILAALAADRDPATDPEVQRHATLRAIGEARHGITTSVDALAADFLTEHTETILAAFAAPFDRAAATITDALEELGAVDLADTRAVLGKGGTAAKVWGEAQTAVATIATAVTTWTTLGALGAPCKVTKGTRLLLIADVPPSTWTTDQLAPEGDKLTAWDAARRGYPLEWATPATYAERLAAIHAEQARRAGKAEAEAKRAIGQPWRHAG